MSAYIRRFTSDPGEQTLLEIESVNILDLEPPASIQGIGTGVVCMFGEFENGPFNTLVEVTSAEDMATVFGVLGYTRAGVTGQDPSARSRNADGAVADELWNGNAFVQLSGKKFKRLVLCRADTSVGTVSFTRLASLLGVSHPTYAIDSGQTLLVKVNGGAASTVTWDSAAATVTGSAGTFLPVAGTTAVLGYDTTPDFTVEFLAGDNTVAACVSRINAAAGFAYASTSGGQIKLAGIQKGTGGQVRVTSGTALTALGLTVAVTQGTGDVADSRFVTQAEVKSRIEGDAASTVVDFLSDGTPRLSSTTAGTGTIEVTGGTARTALGFPLQAATAFAGSDGVIPAGTQVRNAGDTVELVTMQDVNVIAGSAGPYTVEVRHATDDGTGLTAAAGTITVLDTPADLGAFGVTNQVVISAALSEGQIDAAYATAIAASADVNTVGREVNITFSARQSNSVRQNLRQNAIDASRNGCAGRIACIRPPLNTPRAVALGSAEPGVGAYRSDRVVYCYPAARTNVPSVARVGITGGQGFTADGNLDVGADGFLASIASQLAPEENPGQATDLITAVIGIESGANAQGFGLNDYIAFKAGGICALRIDAGTAVFQSGCTAVDPSVYPNLKNIARRRMADFIQDSLAQRMKAYAKKLSTLKRRIACTSEVRGFLGPAGLSNEQAQRIDSWSVDDKRGNTPDSLARGLYRIIVKVRTLSSLDSIVLQTTIGESVQVDELPTA